ncbi:unnamed protein product [Penicillium manginii]
MPPPASIQPNQAACEEFMTERKRIALQITSWVDRLSQKETDSIIHDIRQLMSILNEWNDLHGHEIGDCFHQKVQKIRSSLQFVLHQVDNYLEGSTKDLEVGSFFFISQVFNIVKWQIGRLTLRGYDESDTYSIATEKRLVESQWGGFILGRNQGPMPVVHLSKENDPDGDFARLWVFWGNIHIEYVDGLPEHNWADRDSSTDKMTL